MQRVIHLKTVVTTFFGLLDEQGNVGESKQAVVEIHTLHDAEAFEQARLLMLDQWQQARAKIQEGAHAADNAA